MPRLREQGSVLTWRIGLPGDVEGRAWLIVRRHGLVVSCVEGGLLTGEVDCSVKLVEFSEITGQEQVVFQVSGDRVAKCGSGAEPKLIGLLVLTA